MKGSTILNPFSWPRDLRPHYGVALASRLRRWGLAGCLGLLSLSAAAQTSVGGAIAADTVWHAAQSPYVVSSDITVQNGATLTIEAGTTVLMADDTRFTVQSGALKAEGTAAAPIRVTSQKVQKAQSGQPAPGDWQQLTFAAGATNATRLDYVQIEYGKGIVVAGAAPTFNYLTIRNNLGAAVSVDLAASPLGVGNQASGNTLNAIVVPAGDITGNVTWGLKGIPYLVQSGTVSVGNSPKISTVQPSTLQPGETLTFTLSGSRLAGLTQPVFDLSGLSAQVRAGSTDTQTQLLVTAAPTSATGAAQLTAMADAGTVSFVNAITVQSVQPKLASVTPSTLSVGQGDTVLALKGQNFTAQSVAYLDNDALATTYVSATDLTALVPNPTAGAVKSLRLRTPNPGGVPFVSNDQTISIVMPVPTVSGMTPNTLRRGETKTVQVTGTGLNTTTLSTTAAGLTLGGVTLSPTQASFDLTAADNATLGAQQLTFKNSAGSASATVTVTPDLPTASVTPTPIAVPPDSSSRQFAVQLAYADTIAHSFAVTVADASVVSVSTPTLTIDAGKTQAIGSLSGLKAGVTSIRLVSATLGTLTLPVYVTADFLGLNTSYAQPLGVVLETSAPATPLSGSVTARSLGIVSGNYVKDVTPKTFATGSGAGTLTIVGEGLQNAVAATLKPADGVTLGSLSVAADGKSVTVPLTVADNAPVSLRQVVLSSASGAYPVASPDADRIQITLPRPEIVSVDPLFGAPGTSALSLTLIGRNLQAVQTLSSVPPDGLTFGASPTVNADGTRLTAVVNIASSAAPGARVIVANAPGSSSDPAPTSANTFTVATGMGSTYSPVVSPALGVVKQESAPANPAQSTMSRPLGVAYGSVGTGISPQARAIGESFTLTVQGLGLQGVTAVSIAPATGISLGTPTIAADGQSLTVPVSIAADAPQTPRTVNLTAGPAPILFVPPASAVFNVTALEPVIDATDPVVLQIGATPVTMTLRGRNFQGATSVRLVPPEGMSVNNPPTGDAAGTQLTVSVSASSGAAPGQRAVIVTTPGGESPATLTAANTVTLGGTLSTYSAISSPLLGVLKQDGGAPASITYDSLLSRNLGVVFGAETPPALPPGTVLSGVVGVAVGPVATAILPTSLARSASGTLVVSGHGLGGVTAIALDPPQGVVIGSPLLVSEDGGQVSVPVTVAADAAMTRRRVDVRTDSGKVSFANPVGALVQITSGALLPISSISPILGTAGATLTLVVRGQNMQDAIAVVAAPATGLVFDTQPTVNADGTELTVRLRIDDGAPLGARVIRVITPTTESSDQASVANTFTIYAP